MSKAAKKPSKLQNQKSPKVEEKIDIEAQLALEEQRRQEELKRKEEEKLTEVITLPTGLRLILNAHCVEHAWTHPKPKEYFSEYMTKFFKKEGILENFESIEIAILSEFHLYNLIFAIEDLKLDKMKTCVFMNIMFHLIINENRYYKEKVDQKIQKEADREGIFKNKTEAADLKEYERLIMNHCVENPPRQQKYFELNEVRKITEYVRKEYFMHYKLYKYVLCNKQKNEEIKIQVYVDHPTEVQPLSQALFMGKIRHEVKQDDDEEMVSFMSFVGYFNVSFIDERNGGEKTKGRRRATAKGRS